jgi:hypothetical protein
MLREICDARLEFKGNEVGRDNVAGKYRGRRDNEMSGWSNGKEEPF